MLLTWQGICRVLELNLQTVWMRRHVLREQAAKMRLP